MPQTHGHPIKSKSRSPFTSQRKSGTLELTVPSGPLPAHVQGYVDVYSVVPRPAVIELPTNTAILVESFASTLQLAGLEVEDETAAAGLGAEAARFLIAQHKWATLVGDTLDTAAVRQLLGLTRQALEARRRNGSLLGLASDRSGTLYPRWQFDSRHKRIRPEIASIVSRFRNEARDVTEATIVSWASAHQADLDGETPADWLVAGKDTQRLLVAATRTAAHLAQ